MIEEGKSDHGMRVLVLSSAGFLNRQRLCKFARCVGKLADVVLVSQDPFGIAPNRVGKTKILLTMVGGKIVYQDSEWASARVAAAK